MPACTNVPRRALMARFLLLDFAQAASPVLVLRPSGSTMVKRNDLPPLPARERGFL
jgi:hypothetical protein